MFHQIGSVIGPVDILVNNAGITRDGVFKRMSPSDWYAVINTNLNSVFNVTRQVVEGMTERAWGRIINISSVNALKGQFGQTNYSAAKAGMHGFSKALAQEVVKKGVTVNTVSPGYVETDMVRAMKRRSCNRSSSRFPWGGSRSPRRSRASSPISPPRRRATSRGRTSRSTAACTWFDSDPNGAIIPKRNRDGTGSRRGEIMATRLALITGGMGGLGETISTKMADAGTA